jgi:hypothetical protein
LAAGINSKRDKEVSPNEEDSEKTSKRLGAVFKVLHGV